MNDLRATLAELIEPMHVPEYRRDVTDSSNVRWLARNLGIHNGQHPNYPQARRILRALDSREAVA